MVAIIVSTRLDTVVPVKDVVRMAHERSMAVIVDGAEGAVHLDADVADIDCDERHRKPLGGRTQSRTDRHERNGGERYPALRTPMFTPFVTR
jgi:hypothetical protein